MKYPNVPSVESLKDYLTLKNHFICSGKKPTSFGCMEKKQKYLVEHVMATLGEVDGLTHKKLKQRLNKEDMKAWLNLGT